MEKFIVKVTGSAEAEYAELICKQMETSAKARGTGIAKRSASYIADKMVRGEAFIVLENGSSDIAGFCYIESWSHGRYVANSGLIIFPEFRRYGLAKRLKKFAFEESRKRFPHAKLFGLTTSDAVMSINSDLGYRPVTYSHLTDDQEFWKGCRSCVNYPTLTAKKHANCFCTAMLYDPNKQILEQAELIPIPRLMEAIND